MRLNLLTFLLFLFVIPIFAQEITPINPADSYCRPGVANKSAGKGLLMEYTFPIEQDLGTVRLPNSASSLNITAMDSWNFKLKIPMVNKPDLKILAGLNHLRESYQFNYDYNLPESAGDSYVSEQTTFKNSRLTLYAVKSLNSKNYLALRGGVSFAGDYDKFVNLDSRYAIYRGAAVFGWKINANKEFAVGTTISNNWRRTIVLPFAIYNQTFNDKWGIETILPIQILGRYNINEKSYVLFGGSFRSLNYSIDAFALDPARNAEYTFNRQFVDALIRYEYNIASWMWLSIKGGYQFHINNRLMDNQNDFNNILTAENNSGGPFLRFGLFLSPPKNFIK